MSAPSPKPRSRRRRPRFRGIAPHRFEVIVGSVTAAFIIGIFGLNFISYNQQKDVVIRTFLDLEKIMADKSAADAERWYRFRMSRAPISDLEGEMLREIVEPIHFFQSGDAWLYSKTHVIFDQSSDFPADYRDKSIAEIFGLQAKKGASHYEDLIEAVRDSGSGTGYYIWLPSKGREWAAWSSFSVGSESWTLGISTPEREILENYGVFRHLSSSMTGACLVTAVLIFACILLMRWYRNKYSLSRRLDVALEEARNASEAKSSLIAVVSHELRNPLNAIIGLADLDLGTAPSAQIPREDLEVIRSSGKVLLGLVNDLLDLSKIEAGKMELESADFDLQAQLSGALLSFRQMAEKKGVLLDAVIAEGTPRWVKGDPLRFEQVLMNLLSNAMKFTQKGAVLVELSPWEQPAKPGAAPYVPQADPRSVCVRCAVRDTGIGIAPENLPRLFHEFSQVDASVSRKYGGTGLGLSICKRLAQLFGGEIGVESKLGEGSTFWFTARFEPGVEPSHPVVACGEEEIASPICAIEVLVVDDDPVNAAVAKRYIQRSGHNATSALSGEEAIAQVGRGRFDLVLLDLGLPDMDGFEASRRIASAAGKEQGCRIAAMTARTGADTRSACASAGMIDCLSKPVDPEALGALLARVSAEARSLGPRAASTPREEPAEVGPSPSRAQSHQEAPPAVAPAGAAAIGEEALRERMEGDEEFMRELLSIFVSEESERRQIMEGAIRSRDATVLMKAAHKLKGTSLSLCAGPLAREAAALESACAELIHADPGAFPPELEQLTSRVLEALSKAAQAARTLAERAPTAGV